MGAFLFSEVWNALLHGMPLIALVRNPGKMTSTGLAQPFSDAAKLIVHKLGDEAVLKRARIHPMAGWRNGPCRKSPTRAIFGP